MLAELTVAAVAVDESDSVVLVNRAAYRLGVVDASGGLASDLRRLIRQVRRDGTRRDARITLAHAALGRRKSPLQVTALSLGGNEVAILAEDLTESDRVEAVRRDFVANIGHEIKTPVGAISLLAEAALDAQDDMEALQRFLRRIHAEADRLSTLVLELIELSRLQGGEPLPISSPVKVDDVVDEAIERVRAAADAKHVAVERGGDRGLEVLGIQPQLVTALGNLLDNAISYSTPHTRTAIGIHARDDVVEIAVADQGIGIDRIDQGRIFERFYRADQARSRETGGTGLGLAIVKHIVGNHGGEVTVSSRVGVGSTFTIRLPAATVPRAMRKPLEEVTT